MEEQVARLLTSQENSNFTLGEVFLKEMRLHPKRVAKLVGKLSIIDDWEGYNSTKHFSSKVYSSDRYGSYCHSDVMKVLNRNGDIVMIQLKEHIHTAHRIDNYRHLQYQFTFPQGIWDGIESFLFTISYEVGKFPVEKYLTSLENHINAIKRTIKNYHTNRIKQLIKN